MTLLEACVALLCLTGSLLVLVSAVAMLRAEDAFQRINVLSPATGLGLPLIVLGAFVDRTRTHGLEPGVLLAVLATLGALLVVSSVASNTLARASYRHGAPVDPRTHPQDLRDDPGEDLTPDHVTR